MLKKLFLKILNEQEIHVHHHYAGSDSGSSSKSSSDTKSDSGSSSKSSSDTKSDDKQTPDQIAAASQVDAQMQQQSHEQEKAINQQQVDLQVSKFMNKKLGIKDTGKKDDAQFKEVFIKNHIRRYQRKPSIGMMKQTFGVHN